jgi:hypothetical protein
LKKRDFDFDQIAVGKAQFVLKGAGVQFLDSPRRRAATFGHGLKEQFFDLNQQDSIALLDYFLNQSPTPLPAQVEGAPVPGILVLRLYGFWEHSHANTPIPRRSSI